MQSDHGTAIVLTLTTKVRCRPTHWIPKVQVGL